MGTGGKTPQLFFFVFYYEKQEQERNSRVREQKQDITITETEYNDYGNGRESENPRNALLFNHHSLCMSTTLDTPLHKLFFKNMINISCFLRLKREISMIA